MTVKTYFKLHVNCTVSAAIHTGPVKNTLYLTEHDYFNQTSTIRCFLIPKNELVKEKKTLNQLP